MAVICHIHIEITHIAKNDRITVVRRVIDHFIRSRNGIPAIYTFSLLSQLPVSFFRMSQGNFLPAADLQAVLLQDARHPCNEILRQIMGFFHPLFFHQFPAFGRPHPYTARNFVTAQMHGSQRHTRFLIHGIKFLNHFFHKTVSGRQGHIDDIIRIVLYRSITGSIFRFAQQILGRLLRVGPDVFVITGLHGNDGRTGMSRRFYFRYHADMPFSRIPQQADKCLTGIIPVAGSLRIGIISTVIAWIETLALVRSMSPAASYGSQLLQTGNFQAPTFIIAKMKMKDIHFIGSQDINQLLHVFRCGIVAGYVYHLSAIRQVRIILNRNRFQLIRSLLSFQHGQ